MEPISLTISAVSAIDAALRTSSALVKYARSAHHATRDRKLLAEEALILSKLLQRLREHAEASL